MREEHCVEGDEKTRMIGDRHGLGRAPPSDEDYTLEEILAEYGCSRQQKILEEVERETAAGKRRILTQARLLRQPPPRKTARRSEAPSPTPGNRQWPCWAERIAAAALEQEAEEPPELPESDPEEEPRTDEPAAKSRRLPAS